MLLGVQRQLFDEGDQLRVGPVAVPRQAHRLPGRAAFRQLHHPGAAALGIGADRLRLLLRRDAFGAEEILGQGRGASGAGKGEQRRKQKSGAGDHALSPYGFTHLSRIMPIRKRLINGIAMPIRCEPVIVVKSAMEKGAMNAVALPDSA